MAEPITLTEEKGKELISLLQIPSVQVDTYRVSTKELEDEKKEIDLTLRLVFADYTVFEKAMNFAQTEEMKEVLKNIKSSDSLIIPFTKDDKDTRECKSELLTVAKRFIIPSSIVFTPSSRRSKGFHTATLQVKGILKSGGATKLEDIIDYNFSSSSFDDIFQDLFGSFFDSKKDE